MFRRVFILSFFLGFPLVSPAEASHDHSTCDENPIWLDEVAWANHIVSILEDCERVTSYGCIHNYEPCRDVAESIVKAEKKKEEDRRGRVREVVRKANGNPEDKIEQDKKEEQQRIDEGIRALEEELKTILK